MQLGWRNEETGRDFMTAAKRIDEPLSGTASVSSVGGVGAAADSGNI